MKKHYLNILVLILCLFFSSGKIFSQQTPLLYYSFDKYDSEYVYDESGKENMKGSIHGNSYAWDKGFFGNAFVFSDSQDYIKLPDNINAGMKDFTIGCWVYGDKSFSSWSRIWDIGNGTNNYMFLSPKSGANTLRFAFKKDASSGEEIIEAGFSLYEEMWMHVIVTVKYDDNNIGYGKLYINGNLFGANDNITVTPEMLGLTTSNYIAKSQFAGDPALGGKIDEFVICDYAMEYSEVETLYHNGLPANLFNVYSIFTYSDFSSITTDLDLFTSYDDVNVEWASSDESVISTSGVVTRDKIHEKEVILTATMTYTDENNQTYSISKTIEASVLPLYDNQSLVARWVFENDDIKIENGNVLFTDISENSFEGRMVNDARIRTIGETDQFNVIDLGNGTGYFDMGTEIGKSLVQLSNYTIGAYFRIDNDYTEGNANGNFLWNFSNMNDANNPIGYLICKMVTTGVVITPNNWGSEQGPNMYSNAPKGAWHHICYVQNGNLGYLYLDGELMGYSRVNQTPANTLKRDGLEGTPYNWIGRSCYTGDVYLRKTLVYDFSLYDGAITEDRFFEDIRFGIDALNNAYNENPDYIDPSLIDEYNRLTLDGDLQNVVSDLTLPLLGEDPSVTISWESNSKYISSTGVVTRPESLDANVVLTATLKKGLNVMTKTFNLKVKASDPKFASDLLFRHDFLSSMISGQNVTESGEMNYVATLKNGAIIETLSDDSSDESVNVLSLGESGGYLDLGSEMGEILYNLTDYTMSVFYCVDKEYLNLEKNGNALWSFANTPDADSEQSGFVMASLNDMSQTMSSTGWINSESVAIQSVSPKGSWHHFTFTQEGKNGTVYFDGIPFIMGEVSSTLGQLLSRSDRNGTFYNYLGKSSFSSDVHPDNLKLTDFRIYSRALDDYEILDSELDVDNKLQTLDKLYNVYLGVETTEFDNIKIRVSKNLISVSGVDGHYVKLYDMMGCENPVADIENISVQSGVYILKAGPKSFKVLVP